jgi:hypothetical protein
MAWALQEKICAATHSVIALARADTSPIEGEEGRMRS